MINREGDYEEKIQEMNAEYKKCKNMYREMNNELVEKDKQLIDRHDVVVQLDQKVRKMHAQIKEHNEGGDSNKSNKKGGQDQENINSDQLSKLRDEIV